MHPSGGQQALSWYVEQRNADVSSALDSGYPKSVRASKWKA